MRSVAQNGVLSQLSMREQHMGYTPSHDGRNQSSRVALTRVPGGQALGAPERHAAAHETMHAPHFGALTVALERQHQELDTRPLPLSADQEAQIAQLPPDFQASARRMLGGEQGLSPAGRAEAERRMANTFMMTARNGAPPAHGASPYEESAPSIRPESFNSMLVPPHLASQAHMVQMDMRRAGRPMPPVQVVPMEPMAVAPQYNAQNGAPVTIPSGIQAPGYGNAVFGQTREAGVDTHLVRVPPEFPPHR
ncbi:hypothetical protein CDN98_11045 [Roseateles terrae]|nr:hypothetical protein CDN98_11045 [Roseateles terrae]